MSLCLCVFNFRLQVGFFESFLMYLSEFRVSRFRNLEHLQLNLAEELNIVSGDNAAGKSSLLEAIGYLVSGRSFRTSKQALLVSHDEDCFELFGAFSNSTKLGVSYNSKDKSKRMKLNGEKIQRLSEVAALYPVQILSPESYHLIDSGPSERRKYLDWSLFHVEHHYQSLWNKFHRLLKQRNAFLRAHTQIGHAIEIDIWNSQYVALSLEVDGFRSALLEELIPCLRDILTSIGFEYTKELKLTYYSGYTGSLENKLAESLDRDVSSGNTQYGPHKADLRLKIGKYLAKDVLSRGQKKLLINAMYLAQTKLLKIKTSKDSLFIVDDFSSELDKDNQMALVNALKEQKNVQIILSCLHPDMLKGLIKRYNNVKMFHVEHGQIQVIQ